MRLLETVFNLVCILVPCMHVCLYRGGGFGVGWGVFMLYAVRLTVIVVYVVGCCWCILCVFCEKMV